MFRGLFGSSDSQSPAPPKNQIEVVCPSCGAAQYEPRLVVSTFCKRCGVHLKIEKKRVIASDVSKAGGSPEVLAPRADAGKAAAERPVTGALAGALSIKAPLTPVTAAQPVRASVPTAPLAANLDVSETGELGLGMMMQAAATAIGAPPAGETPISPPASPTPEPAGVPEAKAEPAPPASKQADAAPEIVIEQPPVQDRLHAMGGEAPVPLSEIMQSQVNVAANPGVLQKMRDQGFYRNHHFKEAECFECGHRFKVGRSSRSANCPTCGAYISLEDVELNMPSTQPIKTRGDVLIRKRGQITAPHLYARDLRCYGLISANIFCSGDAIFKTSGTILGEVRCRKFIVEKGSEIEFLNEVHADEIEIGANVKGNFYSKGPLIITASGAVDGSVTGRSISIEPGGELNGSMNIVRVAPAGGAAPGA